MTHFHDRTTRRWFVAALGFALCLLVIVLSPARASSNDGALAGYLAALPRSLTFTFHAAEPQIFTAEDRTVTIRLDGAEQAGLPGDPQLPAIYHTIALPPFVPLDSVVVTVDSVVQTEVPGSYDVAPAGPMLPAGGDRPDEADWGPNAATIVDGRNTTVYGRDTAYPTAPVELDSVAQLRQWRMARLRFSPVSYNPVSGQLRLTSAVTVTVSYDAPAPAGEPAAALLSDAADQRAAELFLNFDAAQGWYKGAPVGAQQPAQASPTYVIVTTNRIWEVARPFLSDFFYHKTAEGWRVHVYTEDEYGELDGSAPDQRADQVRQWLRDNYETQNYQFVLLIGNPDPYYPLDVNHDGQVDPDTFVGEMPMKVINGSPTDFYFADLSNADGTLDYHAEVAVGRIPVYQSQEEWGYILGLILEKTIAYETSADLAWRRSALLSMGFYSTEQDSARYGEFMKNNYLDAAGFDVHRLYWHGALSNSFPSEGELVGGATSDYLRGHRTGITLLAGHGGPQNITMYEEYLEPGFGLGDIIVSEEAYDRLDTEWQTLTFHASCQTGWPEDPNNLGYVLLRRGAVGTVSASRNSSGRGDDETPGTDAEGLNLAYNYMKRVVENKPIGQAFYESKSTPGSYENNALVYNLYGDPSLYLLGGPLNPQTAAPRPLAAGSASKAADAAAVAGAALPATRYSPLAPTPASEAADAAAIAGAALPATRHLPPATPTVVGAGHPRGAAFDPELLVSTSAGHGCAIKPSGEAECWTTNQSMTDYWEMDIVDAPGPYVQVATSFYTSCGLRADGSVHCWGRKLVQDNRMDWPGPYVQISMKYLHVCGLRPDGRADCWGDNTAGQSDAPAESFVQISAGMQHTCGLRANGSVDCWGRNSYGQAADRPGPYTQIDTSFFHTCGLRANGSIDCWGSNHHGQAESQAGIYTQVSAGQFLSCGLRPDGSAHCWGKHARDEPGPFLQVTTLGHTCGLLQNRAVTCWVYWDDWYTDNHIGPYAPFAAPFDPADPAAQTILAAGGNHACGLMSSGGVDCWGDDQYDQAGLHNGLFKAVETGDNHSCALGVDGKVVCWGKGDADQTTGQDGPFVQLAVGANHNCALRADGRAECWGGAGDTGKLEDRAGPFAEIASGRSHNCAIRTDGSLDCWGDEDSGQLNYFPGRYHQITAGHDHTCALNERGSVVCWGIDSHGQVIQRNGLYTYVSAGDYHTCALDTRGQVTCWGANDHGQSAPPAGPFVRLAAGDSFTCGLRPNGQAVCWGRGNNGQTMPKPGPFGPYVPPVNHPPVAANQAITTRLNTPVNIALAVADEDGDSLVYSLIEQPQHGQLTGVAPNLVYTPATGYYGFDRLTYKANDGQVDSNVAIVDITVTPVAYWELFLPFVDRQ